MLKNLKRYQIQLTPFEATKNWSLNNVYNKNLLLYESTGSEDGFPIALEFIDYGDGSNLPQDNSSCNIALEQQNDDLAILEEGLNVSGLFYPELDPINQDGTYKRPIYYQVRTMFYNTYRNPTEIWGEENIDFELGKTKLNLSDEFRLFNIPQIVFGEKINPNTVNMFDNTTDESYLITDDGNGNLLVGTNIFSSKQELGEWKNDFNINESSSLCDWYWENNTTIYNNNSFISMSFYNGIMIDLLYKNSSSLQVGFVVGSMEEYPRQEQFSSSMLFGSGYVTDTTFTINRTGSLSDSSSLLMGLSYGTSSETTIIYTSSFDSSSLNVSLFTGSYVLSTFVNTMSFDSSSVGMLFYNGIYGS